MAHKTTQALVPQLSQPSKRDLARRKFSQSDDNTLVKQARETHSSESHYLDVAPVLDVVETILHMVDTGIDSLLKGTTEAHAYAASDEKITAASFSDDTLNDLSSVIRRVSGEIFCKCSGGEAHASTMSIFKILSNYPWEAKAVLSLAGFSVTYGEFWLVAQLSTTSAVAKSVAQLKQVSEVIENSQTLKPQIDTINKLVGAVLNVTKRIVEFNDLPTEYLSPDSAQILAAKAHIPAAVYWIIRSIVACASHIMILTDTQSEHMGSSTTELWELSSFAHKLINIHDALATELDGFRKFIAERMYEEEHKSLTRLLEITHMDNIKVLKALISTRDEKPLLFGSQKTTVSIDVLRRKHVLLLISDLDISHNEIVVLQQIYEMRTRVDGHDRQREAPYEIVWVPMIDRVTKAWDAEDKLHRRKFDELLALMTWHVVRTPTIIEPHVVKYIREKWHFDKKMIIVALDPMGKVSSMNAANMMWIWGNAAFPFSHEREEALWGTESWTPKLVIDGIDPGILQWFSEEKYLCLYGSNDIGWIKEFTKKAKAAADYLKIDLEMIYVGESNAPAGERLNKIRATVESEGLSRFWPDPASVWFFWSRIDAMRRSKSHCGRTIDTDPVLKEIMVLLSYDGSGQGWAAVWHGTAEAARASGQVVLEALREFEQWRDRASEDGLVAAFNEEMVRRHSPQHCTRLILPGIGDDVPGKVTCTECGRDMEKFFMFRCCTD